MYPERAKQFSSLEEALASNFGPDVEVVRQDRASGSDLNEVWNLTLSTGDELFLKTNPSSYGRFFSAEAAGLAALQATETISVPHCFGYGRSFLLMERLPSAPRRADFWETFAVELAAMHRAPTKDFVPEGTFGFYEDNVIGTTKQINTSKDSWVAFFRDCRLRPQIDWAKDYFRPEDRKTLDRLLDRLEDFLPEPEYPSLLHGDLWGGNFMTGPDGKAWLIDPAVYVGHREADLAMTELFGGFSREFYEAYFAAADIPDDYRDRRDLYNLYHLLNHLNLFGGSYYGSVLSTVRKYTKKATV